MKLGSQQQDEHSGQQHFGSKVSGTKAYPTVRLAHGLSVDNLTLGYRILSQGRVVLRSTVSGRTMQWVQEDEYQRGMAEIDIPNAAILHCFVSYGGTAQHYGWLRDPTAVQNARRAVYELFDNKLDILSDFLTKSQGRGRDARDLEFGVAWLLWMLGFSVAHLGGTKKTEEAPDLVANTPNGHFAVIECTTGLLRTENKLSLLIGRAQAIRRRLDESNNRYLRVLSVMVTSNPAFSR